MRALCWLAERVHLETLWLKLQPHAGIPALVAFCHCFNHMVTHLPNQFGWRDTEIISKMKWNASSRLMSRKKCLPIVFAAYVYLYQYRHERIIYSLSLHSFVHSFFRMWVETNNKRKPVFLEMALFTSEKEHFKIQYHCLLTAAFIWIFFILVT